MKSGIKDSFLLSSTYQAYKRLTNSIRLMPHFIIIGAQKCGTTSLYEYLQQHSFVAPATTKEIHFFDINFSQGISWYRMHFPSVLYKYRNKQTFGQNIITGEASPYYIFHPLTPKRISKIIPQVKLIVLLRNPVDRAYSHYQHVVRMGAETLSFEEAIQKERERISGEEEKILRNENYYSFNHQIYSYLSRGIYVDQLKVWSGFFPKEQFLIIKFEDLSTDTSAVFKQVLKFLNLPESKPKNYLKYNCGCYPEMAPTTRKYLNDYFKPYNEELYEYLGKNFGW
ncbi:sulfotransferase domain-containing protein [Nostoc sp.]|uniref:sulfotransferase domain-containing protein n=1 Tax=Nostoc sp. TaxID=1180 RepID=UPI002FF91B83